MIQNLRIKQLLFAIAGLALPFTCASARAQDNIALGKTVTFSANPNYALTTDTGDAQQLTDGQYTVPSESERTVWRHKSSVGWQYVKPVTITIDLGSPQPVSGLSYSTGAGAAGVTWPTAIYVAVSDDGQTWRAIGDLAVLSRKNGVPRAEGYEAFRYVTRDLRTRGRYIALSVVATPYVFADEIEVYKGDESWLSEPVKGEVVTNLKEHANLSLITSAAQRRLYDDIATIQKEIDATTLPAARKNALSTRLAQLGEEAGRMPRLTPDFQTVLPLDETHRGILAVFGEVLAARGLKPITVWKSHRYAVLPHLARPSTGGAVQLGFSMLRDQFRSDSFLVTNAGSSAGKVTLQLKGAPATAGQGWLTVNSVAWIDTSDATPVADALIPVRAQNGVYTIDVPAGMTRKVWLTVDSSKVPAGAYRSTLEVSSAAQRVSVPLSLNVSRVAMKKPRLSLTMWDYSNGNGSYGMNAKNQKASIALMRSHGVDSPWATSIALPRPEASAFDAQGNLKGELDFTNLDQWVARWPGAKRFYVFANVPDSFAGAKMDTPQFHTRVGSWAKAISQHVQKLGLKPEQLGILLVDEPYKESHDVTVIAWAKAINATAPELTLFSDPRWARPDQTKHQEAITLMDVLCAALPTYKNGGTAVQSYYQNLRAQGRELWFYQTNGPSWGLNPQLYYRYQSWHAFAAGAAGHGFWSFSDTGKAATSWNGYSNIGIYYAPAYLDKETVYNSVHWEAVREGMEDHEELAMLRDAVAASRDTAWKARAEQVLNNTVNAVTKIWDPAHYATSAGDPSLADRELGKVREMLGTAVTGNNDER